MSSDSPGIILDLTPALALIKQLAKAKREGDADALIEAAPLFDKTPGLADAVHAMAIGAAHSEAQGERSKDRKANYELRYVARARAYNKRRNDPSFQHLSDSDLKALCGKRLVRDPVKPEPGKHLRGLSRSQAIQAIDQGLKLIATGRFALSSG